MKLRLYALRKTSNTQHIKGIYFTEQRTAKASRDELNKQAIQDPYVVCPGPDHKKYKEYVPF